jgi:hypothetical protein
MPTAELITMPTAALIKTPTKTKALPLLFDLAFSATGIHDSVCSLYISL